MITHQNAITDQASSSSDRNVTPGDDDNDMSIFYREVPKKFKEGFWSSDDDEDNLNALVASIQKPGP